MSNFYLDIDGPSHMDKYLQVKHEDTADDGPVLGVARVLDKEDSKIEAEKIVKRYNAYEDLIEAAKLALDALNEHEGVPSEASDKLATVLMQHQSDEAPIGEPTT